MRLSSYIRTASVLGLAVGALAACSDTNVPFYTAPTQVPNTPGGIQNGVTGLFAGLRSDMGTYMQNMNGYSRTGGNFTATEPRTVTYPLGVVAIPSSSGGIWPSSFANILQAHQILATIPNVAPAYTTAQANAIVGIVQTLIALNYMHMQEDHDTLGGTIQPAVTTANSKSPALCNKDMWKYIVAVLDSGEAALNAAGPIGLPVVLPNGFSAVSSQAAPSTVKGSFASFNRALAGKANLELAYAIARSTPGGTPTATQPGSPDVAALNRGDSAITASALYDPGSIVPPPKGGWTQDGFSVFHDYSATSGDVVNPMNGVVNTWWVLKEFVNVTDTANDLRWKNKFIPVDSSKRQIQQPKYSPAGAYFTSSMYGAPSSNLPLVRNEGLVLDRAQIQIGLGNYAVAAALINGVRTQSGGPALPSAFAPNTLPSGVVIPAVDPNSYPSVRDFLLREQQISMADEGSGDRAISIRMYNLALQLDTTWVHDTTAAPNGDQHTTIDPIPFAELSARGGAFNPSCP
ncbi:MAG TPA: hypothetical protein VFA43_18055 [Gemmatimonadaceae bacterium]|nr:hypothetical protein [Gemmatimonadaceae bacterium]